MAASSELAVSADPPSHQMEEGPQCISSSRRRRSTDALEPLYSTPTTIVDMAAASACTLLVRCASEPLVELPACGFTSQQKATPPFEQHEEDETHHHHSSIPAIICETVIPAEDLAEPLSATDCSTPASGATAQEDKIVSDRCVLNGVGREVDRTLPFWRCFVDMRIAKPFMRLPVVMSRDTTLVSRKTCSAFPKVDVVCAQSTITLRKALGRFALQPSMPTRTRAYLGTESDSDADTPSAKRHKKEQLAEASLRRRYWMDLPFEQKDVTLTTFHFVHHDANKRGVGSDRSYHVQTVISQESPAVLQCVAGTMVSFAAIVYTSLRLVVRGKANRKGLYKPPFPSESKKEEDVGKRKGKKRRSAGEARVEEEAASAVLYTTTSADAPSHGRSIEEEEMANISSSSSGGSSTNRQSSNSGNDEPVGSMAPESHYLDAHTWSEELRSLCPAATSSILVLGMGGNSIAVALRDVLGPQAEIHIIEIEPAMVAVCKAAGTYLEDDPHMHVHVMSAEDSFAILRDAHFDMAFMDLFEPMQASMQTCSPLVRGCLSKLREGGLLVVNDHQLPSLESLKPFGDLVGETNVLTVNLHGWKESVIVAVKPGESQVDGLGLACNKRIAYVATDVYECLAPGWLPHYSWLKNSSIMPRHRYRIFES